MKKFSKVFAALATAATVFGAIGLFAACDGEIPSAGCQHQWGAWETIGDPATCTTGGKEKRVCELDASHVEERDTDPLDHDYGAWVDDEAATCTTARTQKRVCSRNEEHVETQTVGDPLDHAMTAAWEYTNPTAENKGAAVKTCTRTGCSEEERVELPALTDEGYEVSTTATCTEAGETSYSIVINGQTFSFAVQTAARGHSPEAKAEVPSTCTVAGKAAYYECGICHKKYETVACETEISEPADLPLAAHSPVAKAEVTPSCTDEGAEAYYECSVCKKKFDTVDCTGEISAPSPIDALGHSWSVAVSDGENGKKSAIKTCSNCSQTEGEAYIVDESVNITENKARTSAFMMGRKDYIVSAQNPTGATNVFQYFGFVIDAAGTYQFQFTPIADSVIRLGYLYLDSTAMISRTGAVTATYTSFVTLQFEGDNNATHLLSATFTATTEHIGKTVSFGMFCKDDYFNIIKTTMPAEPAKTLVEGANKLVFHDTEAVLYTFTPSETKKMSLNVPAGFAVYFDANGEASFEAFFDNGSGTSAAGKNFDAVENETMKWWFIAPSAQVATITIGDPITYPTVTPDSPLKNVSIAGRGVYEFEVGDIEEGNYTLKINLGASAMRSVFCFGKNIAANWSDNFAADGSTTYETAEASFQFPNAQALNGAPYEVSKEGNTIWVIKLDLKAGDHLVIMSGGTTSATITSIALEKTV